MSDYPKTFTNFALVLTPIGRSRASALLRVVGERHIGKRLFALILGLLKLPLSTSCQE